MSKKSETNLSPRIANRKAFHDYHIVDKLEVGIVLHGHEVKSIRAGQVSLSEGWASIESNLELVLRDVEITRYSHATDEPDYQPKRPRRLLAHKRQVDNLLTQVQSKGMTLVPLAMYFVRGKVKIELGVGQGKKAYDKRESIKDRDAKRDIRRALSKKR